MGVNPKLWKDAKGIDIFTGSSSRFNGPNRLIFYDFFVIVCLVV